MTCVIHRIQKRAGIAGQFSVSATVEYPNEEPRTVEFVGSVYGGPVVMRTGGIETFVTHPNRFGDFSVEWVKRFLDASTEPSER